MHTAVNKQNVNRTAENLKQQTKRIRKRTAMLIFQDPELAP